MGLRSKEARKVRVLKELATCFELGVACRRVGVDRKTVWRWRDEDERFAQACDEMRKAAVEELGTSIYERALNKSGKYDERTSAILAMFLYKGTNPEFKDSYRPEVSTREVRFTFEIPQPEGFRNRALPEHVIEGEVVSAD